MNPVIKNAPAKTACGVCGFEIQKGNFAFFDEEGSPYCSKKCVREVYPEFKLGGRESEMANLNVHQKIKRLEREIRMLKYSINQMTDLRKGKLKQLNELRKELTSKKAFEVLAK